MIDHKYEIPSNRVFIYFLNKIKGSCRVKKCTQKEKKESIPKRVRSSSSSTGIKPKGCMFKLRKISNW
jgi:hypothetical protein